jgi:cytochrome P450
MAAAFCYRNRQMNAATARSVSPPSPPGLPLVGHLPAFLADRLGFLDRAVADAKPDAPAVAMQLGERTLVLLDWRDLRHVLVQNAANYDKTWRLASTRGQRLSGSGVLTRSGEAHREQRRLLQPLFHTRLVETFAAAAKTCAEEVTASWTDGEVREIRADMLSIARGAVLRLLFGHAFRDHDGRLARAIEVRRRYFGFWFFSLFPWPERLPVRANREHREALRTIDEVLDRAIAEQRRAPTESLLGRLLEARYTDGSAMPEALVRDELRTLLVTGHETVGECLTWTWIALAQHPEVEALLHAEVDGTAANGEAGDAEPAPHRYAAMVIAESLRLRPPTWIFVRIAREDDVLPSGIAITGGAKIYLCPWVVQRNERYFPDPERFDPERFRARAGGGPPPPGWFPFGIGPRVCLGEAFARLELEQILTAIARRFRLELLPGRDSKPAPGITLHPRQEPRMRVMRRDARVGR